MSQWHARQTRGAATHVRLGIAGACRRTAPVLGLAATRVGDEQKAVEREQNVLDLALRRLVDVLLVVGDHALGNRLADGVDLCGLATARHAHADVDLLEAVLAEQADRLLDLDAQHLGLEHRERSAVDLQQALAGLDVRDGSRVFLSHCA